MDYIESLRRKIGHDEIIAVGAGVFPVRDGKVLLQRRRDNGCWSMHGGSLKIGETPEEAARREFNEETGLTAEDLTLLGAFSGPDTRYTYPNGDHVFIVGIFYICTRFSGEPLIDPDEVTELRWFPVDALPAREEISPPDCRAFAAFAEHMRAL